MKVSLSFFILLMLLFGTIPGKAQQVNPEGDIPNDYYEVLLDKNVIIEIKTGEVVKGKLMRNNKYDVIVMLPDGDLQSILKVNIATIKFDVSTTEKPPQKTEPEPEPEVAPPPLSPDAQRRKDMLISQYREILAEGRKQNRLGTSLAIPGLVLSGIGVGCFLGSFFYESMDSYYIEYEMVNTLRNIGYVGAGVGIPLTIAGYWIKNKGKKKINEAEELRLRANRVTYYITPIYSPRYGYVGINMCINF